MTIYSKIKNVFLTKHFLVGSIIIFFLAGGGKLVKKAMNDVDLTKEDVLQIALAISGSGILASARSKGDKYIYTPEYLPGNSKTDYDEDNGYTLD